METSPSISDDPLSSKLRDINFGSMERRRCVIWISAETETEFYNPYLVYAANIHSVQVDQELGFINLLPLLYAFNYPCNTHYEGLRIAQ